MAKKYFSLEEANQLMPDVREAVLILQQIQRDFKSKRHRLQQLTQLIDGVGKDRDVEDQQFLLECELDFLQMEAQMHMNNVTQRGIFLRSIEMGLVDFPGKKDGELIFWCWKLGEDRVNHFHGWDEGFAGRQLISETPVDYNE
jgi:hypothetical protein